MVGILSSGGFFQALQEIPLLLMDAETYQADTIDVTVYYWQITMFYVKWMLIRLALVFQTFEWYVSYRLILE